MHDDLEPLILDMLEWLDKAPRPYAEVMDTWRTSCPRLPVWEEAVDRDLVQRRNVADHGLCVVVTANGDALLRRRRTGQNSAQELQAAQLS